MLIFNLYFVKVEWSVKGSYIAVARKDILSIFSSKLKERSSMVLSFKSWIGDSDGDYSVKGIFYSFISIIFFWLLFEFFSHFSITLMVNFAL